MSTYSLIQCILRGTFGLWSGRTGRIPSEGLDERLRRSGPGAIWKYRDQLAKSGRTKELDAIWTKKHGVNHFGCKNYVTVDRKDKLVCNYETTAASTRGS